jgi:hypothetical protein
MKTRTLILLLAITGTISLLAQSELVKKKAKDLKRDVETQQTNQIKGATNAPIRK